MHPYASVGTATVCRAGFQCSPGRGRGSIDGWEATAVFGGGILAELDILSTWDDSEVAICQACSNVTTF